LLGYFGFLNFIFMVSYINNNSFPKPLSLSDERDYFEKFRKGDLEAKNILIERNLRLVAHIVKKYNSKESEDLISIGTIGLIKAINTFREDKSIRIATYAARCIENEILMHIRASKKYFNEISINGPIGIDNNGNEISFQDKLFDPKENIDDKIDLKLNIRKVYEIIKSCLPEREKIIIALRYGLINGCEKTQFEIAKLLNISRSYVSRIEKKALKKIKQKMSE